MGDSNCLEIPWQVALTKLSFGVNVLQNNIKVHQAKLAHDKADQTSRTLAGLRTTLAETHAKLNEEVETSETLRGFVDEALATNTQLRASVSGCS